MTFFQTKDDIPKKRDKSDYPKHAFLNLYVLRGEYKDFQAYYDAVINARRSRSISDNTFLHKDLPQGAKALFKYSPNWDCREETVQQDRPLFSVDCIMLNDIGVIQLSAHGEEEKEVLDKAALLRDTMLSLKINKSKRPD